MSKRFPDSVTFRTGVVRSSEVAYVLAEDTESMEEGASHTALLTWKKGQWLSHIVGWVANAACVRRTPIEQVLMIGEDGEFLVGGGGGKLIEGEVPLHEGPPKRRGPLRSVRAIDGVPYAVGMGGVVFRQDKPDHWARVDDKIPSSHNLESIAGFSESDMYAVGRRGVIWHRQGGAWRRIDSPTTVILTSVCCAGDGNVYACGQNGTLLRGREDQWETVGHDGDGDDMWDVEWFRGKLYVATMRNVYAWDGSRLKSAFGKERPKTAYHLSSADDVLWSIGNKDIMAFDGKRWKRIE